MDNIVWRIDDPNCSQMRYLFMKSPIPLSPEMIQVLKEPFRAEGSIGLPLSKIILYLVPAEDLPILDRIEIPPDHKSTEYINSTKYLTAVDIFILISQYYNTPLTVPDIQRLANLGSMKASSLLNPNGSPINEQQQIFRRTLMGGYVNFKGLVKHLDGYLVRLEI